MVKCIDRISLRGSNPELVKEEGHYEFDSENEEDMKNKKATDIHIMIVLKFFIINYS